MCEYPGILIFLRTDQKSIFRVSVHFVLYKVDYVGELIKVNIRDETVPTCDVQF